VPLDSTTTTSSTTPASGHLQLDTTNVDLGTSSTSAQVLLSDSGPGAVAWKVSSTPTWLSATPAQGTLQAKGSVSVALVIDRTAAPAGTFSVQVAFIATGSGNIGAVLTLTGSQVPATTTSSTTTTSLAGPQISGVGGTQLPSCQVRVSATITDVVPVSSALLSYTLPNGTHGSAGMSRSGPQWSAVIIEPSGTSAGSLTFAITATDSAAASQTSATASVAVTACP